MRAQGEPIVSAECFCSDCQAGGRQIAALPHGVSPVGSNGVTSMVLFRKDRVHCTKGAELLMRYKLQEKSWTNRVVASCCNTGMHMDFDKGPHWVSLYSTRFTETPPSPQLRTHVKSRPAGVQLPDDIPNHDSHWSFAFLSKLLRARAAMIFA